MPDAERIGLSVFSTKKAEDESWLFQHAFVSPPDFEFLKGDHSVVLFGESGAGKTASYMALEQYGHGTSSRLIVRWSPQASENIIEMSTALAMAQLKDILSACARTFLEKLVNDLSFILKAAPATQEYLIWFLKYFIGADNLLDILPASISKKDKEQLQALADRFSSDLLGDQPDMMVVATEFTKSMKKIGFSMIWIMVDGVVWITQNQRTNAVNSLCSILSTLKFFEIPYLCYKMALPIEFEADLVDAIGITRDRAMVFRINWDRRYLKNILEKRLTFAIGESTSFEHIYDVEEICSWLEACGGLNPRAWLEYFRPIIATYWDVISNEKPRKLSKTEWVGARKRSSLHLKFNAERNQVQVGMGNIKILSPEVGAIFSYLYKNQGRYCTKKELYYKAYVPFAAPVDKVQEIGEQLVLAKEYDDLINTVIYRIRQAVEPNPKDKEPVFVTTKRDVGIRLSTQAFQ